MSNERSAIMVEGLSQTDTDQILEYLSLAVPADLAIKIIDSDSFRRWAAECYQPSEESLSGFYRRFMQSDEGLDLLNDEHNSELLAIAKSLVKSNDHARSDEVEKKQAKVDGENNAHEIVAKHRELTKQHRPKFDPLNGTYLEWAHSLFGSHQLIKFLYEHQKDDLQSYAKRTDSEMFRELADHFSRYRSYPDAYTKERHTELFRILDTTFLDCLLRRSGEFDPKNESFDQFAKRIIERLFCWRHHTESAQAADGTGLVQFLVRKMASKGDREELGQHVFEKLLGQKAGAFDHKRGNKWPTFANYVIRSIINDFYRRQRRDILSRASEVEPTDELEETFSGHDSFVRREEGAILRDCLERLKQEFPANYQAVIGHVVDGKQLKDIAENETTASMRKRRGLVQLKKCLESHGVTAI